MFKQYLVLSLLLIIPCANYAMENDYNFDLNDFNTDQFFADPIPAELLQQENNNYVALQEQLAEPSDVENSNVLLQEEQPTMNSYVIPLPPVVPVQNTSPKIPQPPIHYIQPPTPPSTLDVIDTKLTVLVDLLIKDREQLQNKLAAHENTASKRDASTQTEKEFLAEKSKKSKVLIESASGDNLPAVSKKTLEEDESTVAWAQRVLRQSEEAKQAKIMQAKNAKAKELVMQSSEAKKFMEPGNASKRKYANMVSNVFPQLSNDPSDQLRNRIIAKLAKLPWITGKEPIFNRDPEVRKKIMDERNKKVKRDIQEIIHSCANSVHNSSAEEEAEILEEDSVS